MYEFICIGAWSEPTREKRYADININYSGNLPEFYRPLLKTSAIDPVGCIVSLWGDELGTGYERAGCELDKLICIPEREGPTFVFAQFMTPHPNHVFKSNGDFLFLGVDEGGLYASTSPLNSFRLVAPCFAADLKLLPDGYYYWCQGRPCNFIYLSPHLQKTEG